MTLLNRKAIEEYQNLNFDEAQRLLREALTLASNAGLSQHPIRARTYVTLGIVTLGGLKQREAAIDLFRMALQIQPEIKLSRGLANPEIQSAFDEAVETLAKAPPLQDNGALPVPRLPPEKLLVHVPVQTSGRGQAISIVASPHESLAVNALMLAYRAPDAAFFTEVPMQQRPGGLYEGSIPASATTGSQATYYLEARGGDGKTLASRGSANNPLVVTLFGGPMVASGGGDSTTTPGAPNKPKDDEHRMFFSLTVGTGAGWTTGTGEVRGLPVSPAGIAWARAFHIEPQIGYFVTSQVLISAQARLQLLSGGLEYRFPVGTVTSACGGDGTCSPATGAISGLAKATLFLTPPKQVLRPFVSVAAGFGQIRHVTDFPKSDCGSTRNQACVDSVAAGPIVLGPAAGMLYRMSDGFALVFSLEALAALPTNKTFNVDANLGATLQF
jgi:hypothetical protein